MPEQPHNQPSPDGSDQPGRSDELGRERPRRLRPSGGYRKLQEGGYSEQLAAARIAERQKQQQRPGAPGPAAPACPRCGKPMALRTARKGEQAGSQFWGCSGFPECKGTRALEASDGSDRSDRSGRPKRGQA